ncbi:hypothetical protein, partial [Acidocella sp.]|uniref:hypothetical protein n=1 Tax=Acidocella sp. TaxID=50710 RepID=UPI002605318A
ETYDEIIEACKTAWNWLIANPQRISSIGSRDWAMCRTQSGLVLLKNAASRAGRIASWRPNR